MPRSSRARQLINRLAREESRFLNCEFLAPATRGGEVRVRLGGVACRLRTAPEEYAGFGVFAPLSCHEAVLSREATLTERQAYLQLFPLARLILVERAGARWLAIPAHAGDARLGGVELATVELVEDGQQFETVRCRWDGMRFWFDGPETRSDPAAAAFLREMLQRETPPNELHRRGLTAEQRAAYRVAWEASRDEAAFRSPERSPTADANFWAAPWLAARARDARPQEDAASAPAPNASPPGHSPDRIARRLRQALAHSGAELIDYQERGDAYRVTYAVDGRRFVSAVAKDDLTVYSAGVCLSGGDRHFDLNSLVGVLREGESRRAIVPMGME